MYRSERRTDEADCRLVAVCKEESSLELWDLQRLDLLINTEIARGSLKRQAVHSSRP